MEHRCGTRHPVSHEVFVRTRNVETLIRGQLRDVSISGGFVVTSLPLPAPAYIQIQLVVEGEPGDGGLLVEGQVVRQTHDGLGIEWSDFLPELPSYLAKLERCRESRRHIAPEAVFAGSSVGPPGESLRADAAQVR
jgi:hypothetical protein